MLGETTAQRNFTCLPIMFRMSYMYCMLVAKMLYTPYRLSDFEFDGVRLIYFDDVICCLKDLFFNI
jgi:hypothetical protein